MKIIENKFIPFKGYSAVMLFCMLFTRDKSKIKDRTIRHESIHMRQMWELLVIGFYLWYLAEWLIRLFMRGNAYRNISFEREAYANQDNVEYLKQRKLFAWIKYLKGQ
jgi:membrane-anchored protein YejM (alkaline phosphatase superfamily)